jgi:hypothetical protein
MKRLIVFIVIVFMSLVSPSISVSDSAEEFLGAPVAPGGHTVKSDETVLEKSYDLSQEQIVNFYKESLKDQKDLKFHERGGQVNIEQYSNLPWQKIAISRSDKGGTTVVITKFSWTWIIGTLTIRFIGVFVVLLVLYLAMTLFTATMARAVRRPLTGNSRPN